MRKRRRSNDAPATTDRIARAIGLLWGQKVLLDLDLAVLYGVETKALKRAMKRNLARFPDDFMFGLTEGEFENLRYQSDASRWGGRRYRPCAFTEQGVAMLSSVLGSERAVRVNIKLMAPEKRLGRPIGFGPWKPRP